MSIREKVLEVKDLKEEVVTIPEWGNIKILIREMTGKQRAKLMQAATNPQTGAVDALKLYPEVIISCSFDPETNEPVFEATDRDAIMEKSASALDRIFNTAMNLSGLSKASSEVIEKN